LRLIISSATVEANSIKQFFETNFTKDSTKDSSCIISIEGRSFNVDLHYLKKPCDDYIKASFETIFQIHKNESKGDILCFLTGQDEIEKLIDLIYENASSLKKFGDIHPFPLYAGLQVSEQMKIFENTPSGCRKVVVSTNIAETSLTIDGIVYVIDCGFEKQKSYDPRCDIERLLISEISQASAIQRSGRAGRNKSGKCYRLYTEESFQKLKKHSTPEIQRNNLAALILQLKALGVDEILNFDFISSPPSEIMIRSLELLYSLGAIDDYCKLTNPLGIQISEFPVDPKLAKMLLISGSMNCSEEALIVASMLTVQTVFSISRSVQDRVEKAKRKFSVIEGDHIMMLNSKHLNSSKKKVFHSFVNENNRTQWCYDNYIDQKAMLRVLKIRQQLKDFLRRYKIPMKSCGDNLDAIRKCIVSGYFSNCAKKQSDGSFLTIRGSQKLFIHPSSCLFKYPPEILVYSEVIQTTKQYMRDVLSIDQKWLTELAPHYYEYKETEKMKEIKSKEINYL
jgi:ATP-dependent RNA helicase DDX35